ncbi:MAG: SCP2 sterol-binding domain-containing protein [Thermoplasmata archaeon]
MENKMLFPSEEWVNEYCKRLKESPDYNKSGKGWKDPILFKMIELDSLKEKPQFDSFILYLKDGICENCEVVKDPEKTAPFKLTATYSNWKKIIDGKINPTQAMLTGQMKVVGNIAVLLRYASAAIAMVKVAQSIPTMYLE